MAKVDIAAVSTPSLISILIPCCGMLEYTKLCVPSIVRNSRPPIELIFLDIGSLDGTAEYLDGIKAMSRIRMEVIRTNTDLGIAEVCQQAISEARGDYLALLNNDTIVPEGWLNQLIGITNMSPAIGLAGPMSNYAAEPQLVETVPYRIKPKRVKTPQRYGVSRTLLDVREVEEFARDYRQKHKGEWISVERLGGFCLLIKREVLEKIGQTELAKWSDLSLFDTDILSAKAKQAGFTLVCCQDLFVHHFGTRTFSQGAPALPADERGGS